MFAIITFTGTSGTHAEFVIGQEEKINEYAIESASVWGCSYDINMLGYQLPPNFDMAKYEKLLNLFDYS